MESDPDEIVLEVARAHGPKIASIWCNRSEDYVRKLLFEIDGYQRGPGRPSAEELEKRKPRWDCSCHWCSELKTREVLKTESMSLIYMIKHLEKFYESDKDREWRARGICVTMGPDIWFPIHPNGYWPGETNRELYDEAKAICNQCPVILECREYAHRTDQRDGVWGGEDPIDRRKSKNEQKHLKVVDNP